MAAKQAKGSRPRHVPQRTCIACRKVDAKRGLRRLVRVEGERVAIDPTGKRAGRGAYLCAERGCWETALKRTVIERALKIVQLHPDDRQMLRAYGADLPTGTEEDKVEPDRDPVTGLR
jgi:predicted RNA-binding protein YlxR (DUF448 family)